MTHCSRVQVVSILLCAFGVSAAHAQAPDIPLAKVGSSVITAKEFISRYELAPMLEQTIARDTASNKIVFLLSMIAERLLADEAAANGIENDPLFQTAMKSVERSFVRDELYRREVSNRIKISEQEIDEAVGKSLVNLKVYFLFSATEQGARRLLSRIHNGEKLEEMSLPRDSSDQFSGPDSAIARWGDVDERMEKMIYAMKLGETSEPILLDDGYYIAKVMGKSVTVVEGDEGRKEARQRVEKVLRKRKEDKRMFEYMALALKDKRADANAKIFRAAAKAMFMVSSSSHPKDSSAQFILGGAVIPELQRILGPVWDSVFVIFPHSTWTLGETIEKMSVTHFTVESPSLKSLAKAFDQRLRDLIDQEHLTMQGYENKLNLSSAVRNDLRVWRDYLLADRYRQVYRDTVRTTDVEIKKFVEFYRGGGPRNVLVKFRHIVVDSATAAAQLYGRLKEGDSFTDLITRYSTDEQSAKMIGKEEFVFLSELRSQRAVLESLNVGEYSAPNRLPNGYEIIMLLGRKYVTVQGRDSLLLSDEEIRAQLRKAKLDAFLTTSLGQFANKYGVDLYLNNLGAVQVTHVPAMVYRFLGFGGRMFGTPFLNIQVDWIDNWKKKGAVMP